MLISERMQFDSSRHGSDNLIDLFCRDPFDTLDEIETSQQMSRVTCPFLLLAIHPSTPRGLTLDIAGTTQLPDFV